MLAPGLVTTLGIVIGVLGVLVPDLYDIGLMVALIGLVGLGVRLADRLARRRQDRHAGHLRCR